jgi:hypothetical protein
MAMRTHHLQNPAFLLVLSSVLTAFCSDAPQGRAPRAAGLPASEAPSAPTPWAGRMHPSEHILSAQFQATVYELQAPAERIGSLDEKTLATQAATPETLLSVLARTGKTRVLYRVDQPVNVFSAMSMIGSSEPVVAGTRTTARTNTINLIRYQNVGLIVRLSAQPPANSQSNPTPNVDMAVQLSVLYPGEKEVAPGQKEMVARSVSLKHSETLALNQPRALLAVSSNVLSRSRNPANGAGKTETPVAPIAYVIRYQFSPVIGGSDTAAATDSLSTSVSATMPLKRVATDPETGEPVNTLTARFQATVYEVDAATNGLPALGLQALASAATPELAAKALSGAGPSKVLYHIDQPVNVFGDVVQVMTDKPMTVATRKDLSGTPVNSYTYHKMGVRFTFFAKSPPKDAGRQGPDVLVSFNMSADSPSKTELGTGRSGAAFCTISQEHNEPLKLGRARVLLAAGSPSAAGPATPFAYIVRYEFDAPEKK